MYSIVTDAGEVIHDGSSNDKDYLALSATLSLELNKTGSLTFVVPPNNYAYKNNLLKKFKTIIRVYKGARMVWKGRILNTSKDFVGRMTYQCEGWLSVLLDSIVRPEGDRDVGINATPAAYFTSLITKHNGQVESAKQLTAHTSGLSSKTVNFPVGNYETTLDYIQSNFLNNESVGGRLWCTESDVYFYADGTETESGQEIIFGENLLDLTEFIDATQIYTILIPLGKDDLTISSVNDGDDYLINQNAANLFGRIWHMESYSDVESPTDLKTLGQATLDENVQEAVTIEISAFDLSLLNASTDSIEVGKRVRVVSVPHNIDASYLCTAVTLDLCNPSSSRYTLGFSRDSMTAKQLKVARIVNRDSKYIVEAAKQNVSYSIYDERVIINDISCYKSGRTVYLSFTFKMAKDVTYDDSIMINVASAYAPKSVKSGILYDETTKKSYSMNIKTDGRVTILNGKDEISTNDIVTGSATWTY